MTKREIETRMWQDRALTGLGFTPDEIIALRRISNTLRRWYTLECGTQNDYGISFSIERDPETGKPYMVSRLRDRVNRWPIADRERGAEKRLVKIMANHKKLVHFLQTDPRGAALYILRKDQIKPGESVNSIYTRGVCVY